MVENWDGVDQTDSDKGVCGGHETYIFGQILYITH